MTDWEEINRKDQQRQGQIALQLGWAFIGVAVIGLVVGFLLGRADRALSSAAASLLFGVPMVVLGLRARSKQRKQSEE